MIRDLPPTFRVLVLLLATACALPSGGLLAGTPDAKDTKSTPQAILDDVTPLNDFEIESSYVGESHFQIKRFDGAGAGRAVDYRNSYEAENSIEATRRVHLFDKVYLKLGVQYERFDFGTTTAPLPSTLQSLNGVVALEYVVKGQPAIFLRVKPGVYFSQFDDINFGSIDAPVDLGGVVPTPFHHVYGLVGVRYSALSKYPFLPILGLVWLVNDHLRVMAVPPEPRVIYTVNDHLDVFIGGELLGEAYKTSYRNDLRPQERRFNGAVLDYSEERVGGGLTYNVNKALNIDFSGGCSLEREFDYYRPDASKRFITRPAPYAKVEISAQF